MGWLSPCAPRAASVHRLVPRFFASFLRVATVGAAVFVEVRAGLPAALAEAFAGAFADAFADAFTSEQNSMQIGSLAQLPPRA